MNSSTTPHKNAYQNFCVHMRAVYVLYPKQRTQKKMGAAWRNLTPDQKESYKAGAPHVARAAAQNAFLDASAAAAAAPVGILAKYVAGRAASAAAAAATTAAPAPVAEPVVAEPVAAPVKTPTVSRDEEELYYIREKRITALTTERDKMDGELTVLKQWNEAFRQTVRQRELLHHYGHL